MAIKKAKANYYISSSNFETYHYETQIGQVKKVDANGNITGDLDTELTDIRGDIDAVDAKGINAQRDLDTLETNVGTVSTLTTTAKTVVPAINELKAKNGTQDTSITALDGRVGTLEIDMDNHNHDSAYLKISGGDLTGTATIVNDKSFAGRTTSGTGLNLAKVNATNDVALGDVTVKNILNAKNGEVVVWDGTTLKEVFHAGNMGHGSTLDADKLDGVEGTNYARRDTSNYFKQNQVIDDGKSLYIDALEGSDQAGGIYWRNGAGEQKGRILVGTGGDLSLFAGSINGHTFKADGTLFSTYGHILDATSREVQVRFRQSSSDAGMGFYMNNSSEQLGMYDWESGTRLMSTNRTTKTVNFDQGLEIQGRRMYVQTAQPTGASAGDIWFDI